MNNLPLPDIAIIVIYLLAMVGIGVYFSKGNKNAEQFTVASGKIPGWAIGISIYATFLSSNTFLGVPGKSFGGNWNAFVFSLSMPLAAWIAAKYFVPFYRRSTGVSAYSNLEERFGAWARTYAVVCFLLTQFARMGSIFFGMALSLQALTGFSMAAVMLVMGVCIVIYTVMGGMQAIIWTEVVQGIVKTAGAVLILWLVIREIPGGVHQLAGIAAENHKLSLGSASFNFTQPGFWVVLLYGFFINLNNFGMDQNYVQRYHTAVSEKQAAKSVWLCVAIYIPASLLFFMIGTALFAFYQLHPALIESVKLKAAAERLGNTASVQQIKVLAAQLQPADYGDKVLPHFMVTKIPAGLLGLIVAAILSAAMSTISSGMNAAATVFTADIIQKYFRPSLTEKKHLRILHVSTVLFGLAGLCTGIAMIGSKSILDIWWELSGIFAGGMLGLFLLGLVSRRTRGQEAFIAVLTGVAIILWMSLSAKIPAQYAFLRNPLQANMVIVVGTLSIFLIGLLLTALKKRPGKKGFASQ